MSKKIAAASIVCLVFGGVSIPGGIFINDLVTDMTYSMVPDGLIGIRDLAGPEVTDMVLHTFTAFQIDTVIQGFQMEFGGFNIVEDAASPTTFFNNQNYEFYVDLTILGVVNVFIFKIQGVGKYLDRAGTLSGESSIRLLWGHENLDTGKEYPGLITDTDSGSGVGDFLSVYEGANSEAAQLELEEAYECTWEQLTEVYTYITEYLIGIMVQQLIDPTILQLRLFGTLLDEATAASLFETLDIDPAVRIVWMLMPELDGLNNPEEIGQFMLYSQWANGTLLEAPGFALPLKAGDFYGFEVGVPIATNMSQASARGLFDEDNEFSLVSGAGSKKWLSYPEEGSDLYNELRDMNGLSDFAMHLLIIEWGDNPDLRGWLESFQLNLMPYLAQEEMDLPTDSITLANMLEVGMIGLGGVLMALSLTGFVSNRVVKHNAKKPPVIKSPLDKYQKYGYKPMPKEYSVKQYIPAEEEYKRVWNSNLELYEYRKVKKITNN